MSKTNRMYKIFMTVMVTIIAGLLLACGVIAVKNSMRVKMSIPANPNFLIEIYIQKDGSETQNLVFKNYGDVQIKNGFSSLSGNKLIANGDDFIKAYGGDFSITIKNFTENMPMLVTVTSTATLANGNDGVPAEITAEKSAAVAYDKTTADEVKFNVANKAVFPQTTLLEIKFEQINGYVVSFNANGGSGAMAPQQHALDGSTALTECTFTAPAGKEFAGWATSANGSVEYTDGESVGEKTKAGEEIVLYAVWQAPGFTITYTTGTLDQANNAKISGGWGTPLEVDQGGSLIEKTFTISTEGYSVGVKVEGDCDYSYNPITGVLSISDIQSDIAVTAQANPWQYYTYGSGEAFEGYTYIKFANDSSTEWVIIGSGDNLTSSLFDASQISGFGGANYTYTKDSTDYTLIGPNPNPVDKSANGTGTSKELADNQILLLRREMLAETSTFGSTDDWSSSDVKSYLNTTWTDLDDYKVYMSQPKLYTAWHSAESATLDDGDDTIIFVLGSRYGLCDGGIIPNESGQYVGRSIYNSQNFTAEDYLGTYIHQDVESNVKIFSYSNADAASWWLRTGWHSTGGYGWSVASYVDALSGSVGNNIVHLNNYALRPSFILNLA